MLLKDLQELLSLRGWMLPVTPGTQIVTIGGAIANDVHGKNHHAQGSFGNQIVDMTLLRTDGTVIECGPTCQTGFFTATIGGLGLTGVILKATIQLVPAVSSWLEVEDIPFSGIDEFLDLLDKSAASWEYTASWVDCLSKNDARGIFKRGNFTQADKKQAVSSRYLRVPIVPPISLVNKCTLRPFNQLYYHSHQLKRNPQIEHYTTFLYPLDHIQEWNRIYGPKGFFQYQCVVPESCAKEAIKEMLAEIARAKQGSFLAVLKKFGSRPSVGLLSFPMLGTTLSLDFPNKGAQTHALFQKLDEIVKEAKGRLYPAKDARMPRELFEAGYPKLDEFMQYRDQGISSGLSRRLMGK